MIDTSHVVKTDAFWMFVQPDQTFKIIPPPKWMAELSNRISDGKISHRQAGRIIEIWSIEMREQIARFKEAVAASA